ncbi:MAG: hypothetical protein ACRDPH_13790 [Marmoricola sp.]
MDRAPEDVSRAARRARTMRVPGSAVADISFDSVLDGLRDTPSPRRLTFTAERLQVSVTVHRERRQLRLQIALEPPLQGTIALVGAGMSVPLGPGGTAQLTAGAGPVSLLVEPEAPTVGAVQTAWVPL